MNGASLKRKLVEVYGKEFHAAVAAECEVDKSTVYRWIDADNKKVPGVVSAWITAKMEAISKAAPAP